LSIASIPSIQVDNNMMDAKDRADNPAPASARLLLVDVGGTLLHPHPFVGHVYAQIAQKHGLIVDPNALETSFRLAFKSARAFRRESGRLLFGPPEATAYAFWREVVVNALRPLGEDAAAWSDSRALEGYLAELWDVFAQAAAWRVDEQVLGAIKAARENGWKTGVASNWDLRLRYTLTALGIVDFFDVLAISAEVGMEKPAARLFTWACAQVGVEPRNAVHIGDDPFEDVAAARSVGLTSYLVGSDEFQQWYVRTITRQSYPTRVNNRTSSCECAESSPAP